MRPIEFAQAVGAWLEGFGASREEVLPEDECVPVTVVELEHGYHARDDRDLRDRVERLEKSLAFRRQIADADADKELNRRRVDEIGCYGTARMIADLLGFTREDRAVYLGV